MSEKALVLHSGGLDSTVCLLKAKAAGRQVMSLGLDYGQRHKIELEYARNQCVVFGIERKVLRLEWDKPSRIVPSNRTVEEIRSDVSPAFLPGRNLLFLSLACAEASGLGVSEVWIGVNALDYSGYPDCRPEFIAQFESTLQLAIPLGPKIVAPLLLLSKPEIVSEAKKLGLREEDTWSCYRPLFTAHGVSPCRACDACVLNEYAWSNAGRES